MISITRIQAQAIVAMSPDKPEFNLGILWKLQRVDLWQRHADAVQARNAGALSAAICTTSPEGAQRGSVAASGHIDANALEKGVADAWAPIANLISRARLYLDGLPPADRPVPDPSTSQTSV